MSLTTSDIRRYHLKECISNPKCYFGIREKLASFSFSQDFFVDRFKSWYNIFTVLSCPFAIIMKLDMQIKIKNAFILRSYG